MRYVLDSSVALKWVLPEVNSDKAERLRDRARQGDDDFIAPDFFPIECGHALFRAEAKGILKSGEPAKLLAALLQDCPQLLSTRQLLRRAAGFCNVWRKPWFYDAQYVALAEEQQVQFITADTKLIHHVKPDFPDILDLVDFP
ncbi:MAG TPA: type II toxin-antitoxin system VapC family toxin [Pirellulaceae bacterium]|jgi:predicted nucleic acid-binding protein